MFLTFSSGLSVTETPHVCNISQRFSYVPSFLFLGRRISSLITFISYKHTEFDIVILFDVIAKLQLQITSVESHAILQLICVCNFAADLRKETKVYLPEHYYCIHATF